MKILRILTFALMAGIFSMPAAASFAASDDSAIEHNAAAQPSVKVIRGAVEIENPSETAVMVDIYAITGLPVAHTAVEAADKARIDLPAGTYIVKIGKHAKRVAVA